MVVLAIFRRLMRGTISDDIVQCHICPSTGALVIGRAIAVEQHLLREIHRRLVAAKEDGLHSGNSCERPACAALALVLHRRHPALGAVVEGRGNRRGSLAAERTISGLGGARWVLGGKVGWNQELNFDGVRGRILSISIGYLLELVHGHVRELVDANRRIASRFEGSDLLQISGEHSETLVILGVVIGTVVLLDEVVELGVAFMGIGANGRKNQ